MPNIFELAIRSGLRFASPKGLLTTEQLFELPLTSTVPNKANLNDVAIGVADELDKTGARSFVDTASTNPQRSKLALMLETVKAVIEIKQEENAAARAKSDRAAERQKLLEAIDAADRRELGSKSAAELRAELDKLG